MVGGCYNLVVQLIKLKQMQWEGEHRAQLTHTKHLGNMQFLGYLKSQAETVQTIFSIEKFLQPHPPFYLSSLLVLLKGLPLDHVKQRLAKEYEHLLAGSSFLQRINGSIEARSKCINKIRRDISKASKFLGLFQKEYAGEDGEDAAYREWVEAEGYSAVEVEDSIEHSIQLLSGIFADMSRLRDMTIYVVESIHGWRTELEEHADRCQQHAPVRFFYADADFYETVLEDTSFIWKSKLSSYIWMQAKQDPFFIRNVIHVEERESKTPLERYFLEILYPKEEITVEKSLKCFEMLFFKYKPKLVNRFEEEELLIENYLKLEMKNHEFDEEFNAGSNSRAKEAKKDSQAKPQKEVASPEKKSRLNMRGWVFEKSPIGKSRENVSRIVENHKEKLNIIKNFNIANYAEKNSIALAYLSQARPSDKPSPWKNRVGPKNSKEKSFFSEDEDHRQGREPKQVREGRQVESEPEVRLGQSRMFKSLSKLHPVILEDPKEHLPDTPKHRKALNHEAPPAKMPEIARQPSLSHVKLNSFEPNIQKEPDFQEEDKIEVEEEETPLNMRQFFEVFRADTNKPRRGYIPEPRKEGELNKVTSIRQFFQNARKQRAKSLYSRKPPVLHIKRRKAQAQMLQKSANKSHDSYKQFTAVSIPPPVASASSIANEIKGKDISNIFLSLRAKSIPYELIIPYVKHITAQQHTTSHSFTEFQAEEVLRKLGDPFIHCIIFDVLTERQEHLGQVILSESVRGRGGRLKYRVEFMNIHVFQFVISAILRISEELLATSPCQEVVFPLVVDKSDIVSTHFVELIDSAVRERVGRFGKLAVLEKARAYTQTDVRDRLYVFTSESNLRREQELGTKMMGNYRSLQFEAKCLVLCSNFRLRSKSLFKDTLSKYRNVSLGELYVQIMSKILSKYHLKQLKAASYSLDSQEELAQLLREDVFVRNIIHNLMHCLQEERKEELLMVTVFDTMGDLLHYLRYKKHDMHFDFQFLEDSRFILNHELILAEFDQQASLDFSLTSTREVYVLHNHKRLPLTMLTSRNLPPPLYLLPSANDHLKLFLVSAADYEAATDQLDLFSYVNFFFREIHSETTLSEVPAVVLPNLGRKRAQLSAVRMFDGFFKLFPEREFYSAARVACFNHWESYYPPAVLHTPKDSSLVLDFPFILGFYDVRLKRALAAFLYRQHLPSPDFS